MPTLTIRNVPVEVVEALRDLARRSGRSMEQQVRELLAETVIDRAAAARLIEKAWSRQARATTAEEVESWIGRSRR